MTRFIPRLPLAGLVAGLALANVAQAQETSAGLAAPAPVMVAPAPQPMQQPILQPAPPTQLPSYQPTYGATPYMPRAIPDRDRPIVGYRTETRSQPALWGTGLGLFLAGYVLDFAILTPIANAISNDRDGADEEDAWAWSLLPLAGPVIQLGIGAPHPAIPIATGLMQIAGAVLFIVGLTDQQTVRVPVRAGDPDDPSIPTLGFDATPLPGGGQVSVSLAHL